MRDYRTGLLPRVKRANRLQLAVHDPVVPADPSGAESGTWLPASSSPWSIPFPPPPPPETAHRLLCSGASPVLWDRPTSPDLHLRRAPFGFPDRARSAICSEPDRGISRFPCEVDTRMPEFSDRAGPRGASRKRHHRYGLPPRPTASAPRFSRSFAAQSLRPAWSPVNASQTPSRALRMTRGQCGSLTLTLCGTFLRCTSPVYPALSGRC